MHRPARTNLATLTALSLSTLLLAACEIGVQPAAQDGVGTFRGPDGPIRAAYRVQGDLAIVGGDIAFRLDEQLSLRSNIGPGARWPGGVLVYEIPEGFGLETTVRSAIAVWNGVSASTGVTLVERTSQASFVRFQDSDDGCYSLLGYQASVQPINLAAGCDAVFVVVHELGHAIGLAHEQQRPDRDKYIKVLTDNIVDGFKADVAIMQGAIAHGPYDYDSIMHYPAYAPPVTIDDTKPYMESIMPNVTTEMLGGEQLTAGDVAGVKAMYAGGGGGGGGGACTNPCADYGVAEGECREYSSGSFQCTAGCLVQVDTCGNDTSQCVYQCADYNMAEGECAVGDDGTSWECVGGCLGIMSIDCQPGGGTSTCEYTCGDYGYAEGQCADDGNSAWQCSNGCLGQVASCGGGGNVGCSTPCSDYGVVEGQCETFANGDFQCISGCMTPVGVCAGAGGGGGGGGGGQACDFACGDYGYAEGQCAEDANGAWLCTGGCIEPVGSCF